MVPGDAIEGGSGIGALWIYALVEEWVEVRVDSTGTPGTHGQMHWALQNACDQLGQGQPRRWVISDGQGGT